MFDFKGRTVLITGGSEGIGRAFAERLAGEGTKLILVARNEQKLTALADLLRQRGGTVWVIAMDLSARDAATQLKAQVARLQLTVDVLINNAGFATYGHFEALPLSKQLEEIQLNVSALVALTHTFLPEIERQHGGIIQVASTAAFQPVPFMAVYAATKAFVLSFSEALWGEYRERGIRILALCPGATDTPFFDKVGAAEASLGKKASPSAVVAAALTSFSLNRSHVIQGLGNYLTAQTNRLVPREVTIRITANLMKPKRAHLASGTQA